MHQQARDNYFAYFNPDESHAIIEALNHINHNVLPYQWQQIQVETTYSIEKIINEKKLSAIESLFKEFDINSQEGALLINLASTLIQIPDYYTALKFIEDKMSQGDWSQFIGRSKPWIVNMSALAMKVSARYINDDAPQTIWGQMNKRFGARCIYILIRNIVKKTLNSYRCGSSIDDPHLKRFLTTANADSFCIDICNNEAKNFEQSMGYYQDIVDAIDYFKQYPLLMGNASITLSFNLDALHPCCESLRSETISEFLLPKFKTLLNEVAGTSINLLVNPVQTYQQDLLYILIEHLVQDSQQLPMQNFGVALQAYSPRLPYQLNVLHNLLTEYQKTMTLKLIKGEYWEREVVRAQKIGMEKYPVFTRKESTDLMYLTCVHRLFNEWYGPFRLVFGTHNVHTLKSIESFSDDKQYTIEKVKGSGDRVFKNIEVPDNAKLQYFAPIGSQKQIAHYIKRKLSDNASRNSFINQLNGETKTLKKLAMSPSEKIAKISTINNPKMTLPCFNQEGEQFRAVGYDLNYRNELINIIEQMNQFRPRKYLVCSIIWGQSDYSGHKTKHYNALETEHQELAEVIYLNDAYHVEDTVQGARKALNKWRHVPYRERVEMVRATATYLEENRFQFMDLCIREIGLDFKEALKEVQQAIDYCYIMAQEQQKIESALTARTQKITNTAQGVVACINDDTLRFSSIVKQIISPLLMGNSLVINPSKRNVVTTFNFIQLLYKAGVDFEIIQFVIAFSRYFEKQLILNDGIDLVSYNSDFERVLKKKQLLIKHHKRPDKILHENSQKGVAIIDTTVDIDGAIDNVVDNSCFNKNAQSYIETIFVQDTIAREFIEKLIKRLNTLNEMDEEFFDQRGYYKCSGLNIKAVLKKRYVELLGCSIHFVKPKDIWNLHSTIKTTGEALSVLIQTNNTTLQQHLINTIEGQTFVINKPLETTAGVYLMEKNASESFYRNQHYLLQFSRQKIVG